MILFTSTASSAMLNGFQNSPSRSSPARSPSSTLSSSVSISAVNPTSNTSGVPREIALFDLVELGLHQRREPDLEHLGERALQYLPDDLALGRRMKEPVLGGRIPARAQRGDDGGIRRRTADAEALELFHEARLAVARWRLGEVLPRHPLLERGPVAFLQGRDAFERVVVRLFLLIDLVIEGVIAVEHDARAGRPAQEFPVVHVKIQLVRFVDHRIHLRLENPPPDQLVQLEEVAFQVLFDVVGLEADLGRANRLVRALDLGAASALV